MNSTSETSQSSFVVDVFAIDVSDDLHPVKCGLEVVDRAVTESLQTGLPEITESSDDGVDLVAMSIPVYRESNIISVAVFLCDGSSNTVGVFEVWQPIGEYDELGMTKGFFGKLERFQNVSSFVRFEKGLGLPGQVWQNKCFVIHDQLSSHPGFLRAAGASAESLEVAFGMPVGDENFLATALLISSDATPVARGYEVWRNADDHFVLESCGYQHVDDSFRFTIGDTIPLDGALPGLAIAQGVATVTEDQALILGHRKTDPQNPDLDSEGLSPSQEITAERYPNRALCIPFYEGSRITNVLTLML